MKVYNIKNTKNFYDQLANCEGTVSMIDADGKNLPITDSLAAVDGTINQMELSFNNRDDSYAMLRFLLREAC